MRKGAPVFAALGDETRLRIVAKLSTGGPLSIAQITEGETVTRQAITKHLACSPSRARSRRPPRPRATVGAPSRHSGWRARVSTWYRARWDQRLERLKAFVELEP